MKNFCTLLLLLVLPSLVRAYDAQIDGIYYNLNSTDKTAEVTYLVSINRGDNSSAYNGEIIIPSKVQHDGIEYSVESIGNEAFGGCKELTSVSIPTSVTSIGAAAFYECFELSSFTIHQYVTNVGIAVLQGCSGINSIVVESGNTKYDSRNNCNAIIETETNSLIAGCKNTIIPNSVTTIQRGAFDSCTGLTSLELPNSINSIETYAFWGCTGLTNIVLPNSVEKLGDYVFQECASLVSVTIPNSLTKIGNYVFAGCTALTNVTSEIVEPYSINQNVFPTSTYNHGTLYVPSGTKYLYVRTSGWTNFLKIQEKGNEEEQIYLSLYDGNKGTTKLLIKSGENYTFLFEPDNGWRINTLTYNGADVTAQIDSDGRYTTPSIMNNATLNIVYEQEASAIRSIQNNEKYKVFSNDGSIVIRGTKGNEMIYVYTENGILQTSKQAGNSETIIGLRGNQVYILKIGDMTAKVYVK